MTPTPHLEGWQLREWRLSRDLSQEELARLLGVARPQISKWERDDRPVPRLHREHLCALSQQPRFRISDS